MILTERREATKAKLRSLVDAWKSKYGYRPPKDDLDFLANKSVTSGFMTVSEPSRLTLEYWEGVSICHVSQIENIVFSFLKKRGINEEYYQVGGSLY